MFFRFPLLFLLLRLILEAAAASEKRPGRERGSGGSTLIGVHAAPPWKKCLWNYENGRCGGLLARPTGHARQENVGPPVAIVY